MARRRNQGIEPRDQPYPAQVCGQTYPGTSCDQEKVPDQLACDPPLPVPNGCVQSHTAGIRLARSYQDQAYQI